MYNEISVSLQIMSQKQKIMAIERKSKKGWKPFVDFTDGGKTKGVPIEEMIKELKKIRSCRSASKKG